MILICFITGGVILGADLAVKYYVEKNVKKREERQIWKKRGILRKVHNKGMMMNHLENHPLIVQLASVFAGGILLIWQAYILKKPGAHLAKLGTSMMVGGALSNTYDRVKRGYVVDYLAIHSKRRKVTNVTFNIADVAIFAGAILNLCSAVFENDA